MTKPEEGVTRCPCGAKYWDEDVCHSCGEKYDPADEAAEFLDDHIKIIMVKL